MSYMDIAGERVEDTLRPVNRYIDTLFNRAPVMMHSTDWDNRIVKVNRRWLERLGYRKHEVLGRKCFDFLTEESRAWAVKDTLPLFWRVGSARSIGYQFVKKNGRVLDVLVDADIVLTRETWFTYAALRKGPDLAEWERSSATINALQQLTRLRTDLEKLLYRGRPGEFDPDPLGSQPPHAHVLDAALDTEALGALNELGQDISASLRGLLRTQEEWMYTTAEQQRELMLVAKNIDRTLTDLGDSLATGRLPSDQPSG